MTGFSQELYQEGKDQLIYQSVVADTHTPITASIALRRHLGDKPFFLLESVENSSNRGRYSIIGIEPDIIFTCDETSASLSLDGGQHFQEQPGSPIDVLRSTYDSCKLSIPEELPPMASGLIGYMSYDAIRFIETTVPNDNPDPIDISVGLFMRPTLMLIFDNTNDMVFVTRTIRPQKALSAHDAHENAKQDLKRIITILRSPHTEAPSVDCPSNEELKFTPNMSKDAFLAMVEKAKEYINAGDIFQVVPSQRFTCNYTADPFAMYRSLRHLNPSPFLFFLHFGDFQLIGSSPEILTRLRDGIVTIRPLAGTRKRGKDKAEDEALAKELLADEKEIAEHLMLIDLSRNDVGRVAKAGTVEVTQQMIIEYYSHVMHISSNVQGQINPKFDALDVLFSALPVGTVSGAPKVRAMQIIDELEPQRRSFYAGCVGYFSANGTMDTCITLRTGLIKDNQLHLQAGCGIVADSIPESEYQETVNKAKALMKAANKAKEFI